MDFEPTPGQTLLIDSIRAFVEAELAPHEEAVERTGEVPPELGQAIREAALAHGFTRPTCRRRSAAAGSTT